MAIRNLQGAVMSAFTGKNTSQNLTDATPGTMLSAQNVMVLADNQVRRAPGYFRFLSLGSSVIAFGDFERSVDGAHFVFVQTADGKITAMQSDGTGAVVVSTGETTDPFQFVQNAFVCYASNGVNAWRFVDKGGVLTKYKWGMDPALTAPTITIAAGTLTLAFGRRYVYCPVSKYTDSLGIQRVSVGPPCPISAFTGPITAQQVNLSSIQVFSDPQVNFIWIFETKDGPVNTSSTFYFAAEIANGTTTWSDNLPDASLDQTRIAPFDNHPAPPSHILTTFQGRIVAIQGNQIRLSGQSEVTLGIPEEAWPLSLFFNIPAGSREATAAIVPDQGTSLIVDTADSKFRYTGTDATTFAEQDSVASPGAAGPLAQCKTPFGVAFLSQSKRLWLWDAKGNNPPAEISGDVIQAYSGTFGMEDLNATFLSTAKLLWYSYGKLHFLALIATSGSGFPATNLMMLWSIPVKGSMSSGQISGSSSFYNQIGGIYQTDKIPAHSITAAAVVKNFDVPYIYLGDNNGNIYRFPDGYTDGGTPYVSSFTSPWSLLGFEGKKRFYWLDLYTSPMVSGTPLTTYQVWAAVSDSAEDPPNWILLNMQLVPSPNGTSSEALRCDLQVDGLNVGRYIRFKVQFPDFQTDQVLLKAVAWSVPLYQGAP